MGAMPATEQRDKMLEAAMLKRLRKIGVDRVLDLGDFIDVGASGEQRDPVDQELTICGIVLHLQRIEP
ncbi:hypothetical protein HNP60_002623 [Sphingobium sp. B1D3A]|uniref:Uncharacterized protein n=1 Tax=Sphingobium lignivorans TaxID=2735886 RepID=A0ABR6NKF6_9SPHN|nr:hypothetical protein [Sphingobium lignivorans]